MPGSLISGASAADRINVGAVAAFDNMTKLTALGWFYATTITSTRRLFGKEDIGLVSGWSMLYQGVAGMLRFRWVRASGTTNIDYRTQVSAVLVNRWQGVGVVCDPTVPATSIYTFVNGALVTHTYTTASDGSGAFNDDSPNQFQIFNNYHATTPTLAFQGRGGPFALFPGEAFTAAQVTGWFTRPHASLGVVGVGTGRLWRPGSDPAAPLSVPDLSGNGTHGTAVGTTMGSDGAPIDYGYQQPVVHQYRAIDRAATR